MVNNSPTPTDRGIILQLIGRVLDYMSSPWRAVVVVLLLIICGLSYAIWHERERLLNTYAPIVRPSVIKSDVSPELDDLLNQVHLDIVALWSIDLGNNSARFVQGRQKGGGAWNFQPRLIPAIVDQIDRKALVDLLDGKPVCFDSLNLMNGIVPQRLFEIGIVHMCLIRVPPAQSSSILGVICLGWKVKPVLYLESAALLLAVHDAKSMVMN